MSDDQKRAVFSALRLLTPTGLIGLLFVAGGVYQQIKEMSATIEKIGNKVEAIAHEQARRGPIIDGLQRFREDYLRYHYEYEQPKPKR